jgi:hypothetical protein
VHALGMTYVHIPVDFQTLPVRVHAGFDVIPRITLL